MAWGKDLLDLFDIVNTNQEISNSLKKWDTDSKKEKKKNLIKRMNTIGSNPKTPLCIFKWVYE